MGDPASDDEMDGLSSNTEGVDAGGSIAEDNNMEHSEDNNTEGHHADDNADDRDAEDGEVTVNNAGRKKQISRLVRDIKCLQKQQQVRLTIMGVIPEYDIASLRMLPAPRVIFKWF
jgi:hypothetical protein